eukprot:CAMPEP_0178428520 /NCGR_PEP_ID=MMETSP0689_2-20121128/30323_1 /TAXON_ID=160604 /ORGANISM="Amphidinium massartii, Strain CS-259" /LENGTH=316 /DNA_ID=CAMNT_0020050301 /DNA_START=15 /DNA_END=962 /DNA_ORIENTATION=+
MDMAWMVPTPPFTTGFACDTARAAREFRVGEVVEACVCVAFLTASMRPCFLSPYCFQLQGDYPSKATGISLFPTGWALLLGRQCEPAKANLIAEHEVRQLQQPLHQPGAPSSPGRVNPQADNIRHWLTFRSVKHIQPGDRLEVLATHLRTHSGMSATVPSVFDAARAALDIDETMLEAPSCREAALIIEDAPAHIHRGTGGAGQVAISRLHGLGVSAKRAIACGEIIEYVPVLPMLYRDIARTQIRDYVFASDFTGDDNGGVVLFPLGNGGLYNHDTNAKIYPRRIQNQPFLQAWVAQTDIDCGEELVLNYGAQYW